MYFSAGGLSPLWGAPLQELAGVGTRAFLIEKKTGETRGGERGKGVGCGVGEIAGGGGSGIPAAARGKGPKSLRVLRGGDFSCCPLRKLPHTMYLSARDSSPWWSARLQDSAAWAARAFLLEK